MQTVCLRVHQRTLYLGRLQAAACGEQRLLFPLPVPRARAGSSPGCRDGERQAGWGRERGASIWQGSSMGGEGKPSSGAAGLEYGQPRGNRPETGGC